jgi:opacity protein-like surface antigen
MTFHKAWLATGLVLAMGAAPACAADWGGIKDIGGGVPVPVPAPAPVPTFDADSDWYVGLAIGADILQDAKINSYDTDTLGNVTAGIGVKNSSDIGAVPIFGLSFGRYITPSLRAEIAIDYHPDSTIADNDNTSFSTSQRIAAGATYVDTVTGFTVPTFDTSTYNIDRTDVVKLSRTTGLINLLYDIDTGSRFKPYVGGGFGFTWRQLKRTYAETATCTQTTNSSAGQPGGYNDPANFCIGSTALPNTYTTSGSSAKDQIDFAAAVQAGIGYEINDWITWDNGWQMVWEGGALTSTVPTVSGESTVTYSDALLQQFRSGIRVKFN